jgi:hypothetical protein
MEEQWYTTVAARAYLGDAAPANSTFLRHVSEGKLIGEMRDRKWFFMREALDTYKAKYLSAPQSNGASQEAVEAAMPEQHNNGVEESVITEAPSVESIDTEKSPVHAEGPAQISCHRCGRVFHTPSEYVFAQFDEHGGPAFFPVCRDQRCDPAVIAARIRYEEMLQKILGTLNGLIELYEGQ